VTALASSGNRACIWPPCEKFAEAFIAQGWKVTDPEALADIGLVPDHETLIEIPEDVLKFYARRYVEQEGER
jgi:hypothetical protein